MRVNPIFGSSLLDVVSTRRLIKSDKKIQNCCFYFRNGRYLKGNRCGKVIFSQVCVKNSVQGGCLPQCMLGYTPPGVTPLGEHPLGRPPPRADTPLGSHPSPSACWETHTPCAVHAGKHPAPPFRQPLLRTVRILLECILVSYIFTKFSAKVLPSSRFCRKFRG